MSHIRKAFFVSSVLLILACGGCYTKVHEPTSYTVESYGMTQGLKAPTMPIKTPPPKKSHKNFWNLWGLF